MAVVAPEEDKEDEEEALDDEDEQEEEAQAVEEEQLIEVEEAEDEEEVFYSPFPSLLPLHVALAVVAFRLSSPDRWRKASSYVSSVFVVHKAGKRFCFAYEEYIFLEKKRLPGAAEGRREGLVCLCQD